MSNVIVSIVVLILLLLLVAWFFPRKERYPYQKRKYLMSIPERKFYEELSRIIDTSKYVVLPQVPLSRVVEVKIRGKEFWRYHNKINKKIIDFVVFSKPYYEPVLAIEYDDKSHEKKDRRKRDDFLNNVMSKSGITLLRVKYGERIKPEDFKTYLN